MDRDPDLDYDQLIEKMERRFGYQELPETAMIKFSNAGQEKNELLDEWADRILTLATKAFRNLPDEHMNSQAILRFCHGLNDKAAGESAANMRPRTMDDAIDKVKWAKYTRGLVYNKRETVSKGSVQEVGVAAVSTQPKNRDKSNIRFSRVDEVEKRLSHIESRFDKKKKDR
jgi:hypothetical protein